MQGRIHFYIGPKVSVARRFHCNCSTYALANRGDDVIWCKDCGFVGCMNNLHIH